MEYIEKERDQLQKCLDKDESLKQIKTPLKWMFVSEDGDRQEARVQLSVKLG